MTEPPEGGCCRCIISFTITSGFAALFLWLSLIATNPTCSIEQFDVFALNKTTNSTTIHYDLKLNNKNDDKGIYYDTLNLTFYYKPNDLKLLIGSGNYSGFYQGHKKSTHRVGDVGMENSSNGGVKWENDAFESVSRNGTASFRVELVTAVRFKIVFWKTKRRHLVIGGDLKVDDQGRLVKKKKNKGIKLNCVGNERIYMGRIMLLISVLILVHLL